jgi:hypothetical protein
VVRSRRVVVAAGIGPFNRKPAVFGELPALQVSHCYEGWKISEFAGKRVAVIGAGQSALESAALLHEAGADVEPIARIPALRWIGMHKWLHELGPLTSMLYSKYDVGPAGISRLVAYPKLVAPHSAGVKKTKSAFVRFVQPGRDGFRHDWPSPRETRSDCNSMTVLNAGWIMCCWAQATMWISPGTISCRPNCSRECAG